MRRLIDGVLKPSNKHKKQSAHLVLTTWRFFGTALLIWDVSPWVLVMRRGVKSLEGHPLMRQ